MDNIIFIIGVGRSGTSMLMTMLNNHSRITFTPETHFFRFYLVNDRLRKTLEAKGPGHFKSILENNRYFDRINIPVQTILEPFLAGKQAFRLLDVYKRFLSLYLEQKGKQLIGDKDPRNIDFLVELKKDFPGAKVIHIYRDPRDVVLSKTKAAWSAHRPFWLNAIIGQLQLRKGRKLGKSLFAENYFEFSYESLLNKPEENLGQLMDFIGLDFEPALLQLEKSAKELVSKSELQWKNNTFKPLMRGNKEKWKKAFPGWKIKLIEALSPEAFNELAYQKADIALNPLCKIIFALMASPAKLYRLLYELKLKRNTATLPSSVEVSNA